MTYQEYFLYSNFNDIWAVLYQFYQEDARLKPLYASLVDTIKQLPIDNNQAKFTIKKRLDSYDEIIVDGAPAPQEWLVGREVEVDLSSWKDIFARQHFHYNQYLQIFNRLIEETLSLKELSYPD